MTDIADPQSRIRAWFPVSWDGPCLSISRLSSDGSDGLTFTRKGNSSMISGTGRSLAKEKR
jgi:hypothetical protein